MKTNIVDPVLKNFTESLRDIGYTFEIAVADLIDNSISAGCTSIQIRMVEKSTITFELLDNGSGMSEDELIAAMRLASKGPKEKRDKKDLGRFGLGLKTASFSQCKRLTVVTKKDGVLSARQWDLDFIADKDAWLLITPDDFPESDLIDQLRSMQTGTLVIWDRIDRFEKSAIPMFLDKLRKHLSLVFHRFLEGVEMFSSLKISINNTPIVPFNPFNINHPATQQIAAEKILLFGTPIVIQPFILPHHSKISQQEYELYSTEDGYIKSQGFYVYRQNRILIYGTWWGLHKSSDAHKLVRIRIDITNDLDHQWGIDIKKSLAHPSEAIRKDLKRIIGQVTEKGSRPYTGRGRKIEDKTIIQFWELQSIGNDIRFGINHDHPFYMDLVNELDDEAIDKLETYLKGLQAFLPLEAIQARLQKSPHQLNQHSLLSDEAVQDIVAKLKAKGLSDDYISDLLKTEMFINKKELFSNE
jgi:hypothetical protein